MTIFGVFVIYLTILSQTIDAGRKNNLNLSKGTIDPKRFWPIRSSKNTALGTTSTANKAVLYNMGSLTSINGQGFDTEALEFPGNPNSYVQIYNTDGSLTATEAMCIAFYVYVTEVDHVGVLLEYYGAHFNSGFRVVYNKTKIHANFYDGSGNLMFFESDITVPINTWKLVGINFNKLWDAEDQFDVFDIVGSKVTKDTFQFPQIQSVDATGDMRLGGSFDGSCSFKGKISCLQLYNYSHIGGLQKDIPDLCDSALTPSLGELTYTSTFSSSIVTSSSSCTAFPRTVVTTTEPAASTIEPEASTAEPEASTAEPEASTTTHPTPETASIQSQITSGTSTPLEKVPPDKCFRWSLHGESSAFTSALSSSQEPSLKDCAKTCAKTEMCQAFSFKTSADPVGLHECKLSTSLANVQEILGYKMFEMK